MKKSLFIAEKPSVAQEFAKALKVQTSRHDGYLESENTIVTWCVGHLVTMSYPEAYDASLKRWSLETLPFLPKEFKYEVIPSVKKQFAIVKNLLNRPDVETIYVCTDSGREGEYIYRLVAMMAGVKDKEQKRVWIDSQTEEEILRGIKEAKDIGEYDNLSASAYLRAKEDYLMELIFQAFVPEIWKYRIILSGKPLPGYFCWQGHDLCAGNGSAQRTEIREFVKTPFTEFWEDLSQGIPLGEWRATEGSRDFQSPLLYKENGFKKREDAVTLCRILSANEPMEAVIEKLEKKKENKNPPLLFNLAELQNGCSKLFKISPDETLAVVQELYEKKLVTYPRTDARVLSTAVAKEISRNLSGLTYYTHAGEFAKEILEGKAYQNLVKTRYVNDKQITDHYAIIPTGQGLGALKSLSAQGEKVYEVIVRRFLSIFYPPAVYQKVSVVSGIDKERFFSSFKVLVSEGYFKVTGYSFGKKKEEENQKEEEQTADTSLLEVLQSLKKGSILPLEKLTIKEGETSPPKRYTSGSMILAMENAGQLIEDEELRAQIKGSGIGTSATRAEILKKLVSIQYLALNKKTQVITPTLLGEMIFDVVNASIRSLLNPELTASWEKGLTYVAEGSITSEEYMTKLENFIRSRTQGVLDLRNQFALKQYFDAAAPYYEKSRSKSSKTSGKKGKTSEKKVGKSTLS